MPGTPPSRDSRRAVSPVIAALMVVALLGTALGYLLLTAPDTAEPATQDLPAAPAEPEVLTEAEAIAEFKRLHAQLIEAIRSRDLNAVDSVSVPGSKVKLRTTAAIRELLAKSVMDKTALSLLSVEVAASAKDEIRITEKSVLAACFVHESGKDVSTNHRRIRQTSTWILSMYNARWLLRDVSIQQQKPIGKRRAACG